jgi:alkane 1-monooxygenase
LQRPLKTLAYDCGTAFRFKEAGLSLVTNLVIRRNQHMNLRVLKYASPLIIYTGVFWSFQTTGWAIWIPLIYAWIGIPLLELFIKPDANNLDADAEEKALKTKAYDLILYVTVPLQYLALGIFLWVMSHDSMSWLDIVGRTWVMGLACGIFGINAAHELGHRSNKVEQFLAKLLLLTSLYTHFFIEHNKGHHKRVATPEDPSSARYGEWLYHFYYRSIVFSYVHAWQIANREAKRKGHSSFSWANEMVRLTVIQFVFIAIIFFVFGGFALLCFLFAAGIGVLLLESVNYIEHYGLSRKETDAGKFERAMPQHSWNSDHVIGRMMLFELSRHSDHHYLASRKFQVLRHHDESPQMPTGYPGMMLLASVPPLWFLVMNRRVTRFSTPLNQDLLRQEESKAQSNARLNISQTGTNIK